MIKVFARVMKAKKPPSRSVVWSTLGNLLLVMFSVAMIIMVLELVTRVLFVPPPMVMEWLDLRKV